MSRLSGRVIMVSGAARGLGRAIAGRCAVEGARVLLVDVLDELGEAAAEELSRSGAEVLYRHCDITKPGDIASAVTDVKARWGRLDGLVNNASLATGLAGKGFEDLDEATWQRVFDINVKGTWLVTRAAAPMLKASGRGRVVILTSDTALWGADLFLHYMSSKGALIAMARGLARELAPFNVTVNALAPGLTPTEATESVSQRRWEQYRTRRLMERDAVPDDIAGAALFLLSDDAAYVSGQTLAVNGGMTLS